MWEKFTDFLFKDNTIKTTIVSNHNMSLVDYE